MINSVACLIERFVIIIRMRTYMIILHIRKFFDCCVEFILCAIIMLIYKIIFQCIEISFHRGIIIWISGLAHALLDTKLLTKFRFICNIPRFLLRLYLIRSVCYNYILAQQSNLIFNEPCDLNLD